MFERFRRPCGSKHAQENAAGLLAGLRRSSSAPAIVAVACLLTVSLLISPADAGSWKGREEVRDGAVHVLNPADGMEPPVNVELKELWRIGGDTDNEDEFFGVINRIMADADGNIYLLDQQLSEVRIFTSDGEYLNTIGREGEGPGEFRRPADMFFVPGGDIGVLQLWPGKIELLTREGDPAGQFPTPEADDGGFRIFQRGHYAGDHLVLFGAVNSFSEGEFSQTKYLASLDEQGEEIARYHEEVRGFNFANTMIDEHVWDTFDRRWTVDEEGRVYAVTQYPDYKIKVWSPDGTLERVIEREYTHLKRSQKHLDKVRGIYEAFTRQVPNPKFKFDENHKDIEALHIRNGGELWVQSSRGVYNVPEGALGTFDVFDRKGQFYRQVNLMGEADPEDDGFYFVGDRLYVVTGLLQAILAQQGGGEEEEEEMMEEPEPMAVICYQIDESVVGMND